MRSALGFKLVSSAIYIESPDSNTFVTAIPIGADIATSLIPAKTTFSFYFFELKLNAKKGKAIPAARRLIDDRNWRLEFFIM